jgi:glycosyltransferase involved in cell wall biosynthesis
MKKITDFIFRKMKNGAFSPDPSGNGWDLAVFSHLRWEFVTQRPQHLMSQLSRGRKILFVEEPISFTEDNRGTANILEPIPNVTVIQPRVAAETMAEELEPIVKKYMGQHGLSNPVLWFYSASFLEMIDRLEGYSAVVYDCMDELSAFKGAPFDLRFKEQRLISLADIVFTGGKSLYDSKRKLKEENVFCFPSSVDRAHFKAALNRETPVPADISSLRKPVVGYYGVIDERIDLKLLEETAVLSPEVSFAMIGPVVKIAEADLPKNKNIHYLGSKSYGQLPQYLKGMDIAIMPFALNEATEFISPTKTLEFMAAGKPIVSTPIYDVVRDYSEAVSVARGSKSFSLAIGRILNENAFARKFRWARYSFILNQTSWSQSAQGMETIISGVVEKRLKRFNSENNFESVPGMLSASN